MRNPIVPICLDSCLPVVACINIPYSAVVNASLSCVANFVINSVKMSLELEVFNPGILLRCTHNVPYGSVVILFVSLTIIMLRIFCAKVSAYSSGAVSIAVLLSPASVAICLVCGVSMNGRLGGACELRDNVFAFNIRVSIVFVAVSLTSAVVVF